MTTPKQYARLQHVSNYVSDLRYITGYYTGWIPEYLVDRVTDANAYELLKNDETINHALWLRSLFASGEFYQIISDKEPELADIASSAFRYLEDFTHSRSSLNFNSVLFGLGLQKKYWRDVELEGYPGMVWKVPFRSKEVDRRRLRVEYEDLTGKKKTVWTLWEPDTDKYAIIRDRSEVPDYEGPQIQDFIWHFYQQEELNPVYRGMGEVLFKMAYLRDRALQYWGDLSESWSKPYVVVLANTLRGAFSGSQGDHFLSASQRADKLLDTFERMVSRHTIVLQKDADDVRFHEHGVTGNNILQQLLNYCDNIMTKVILGSELTTGTSSSGKAGGSYALAQIHNSATRAIILYDRLRMQERYEQDWLHDFFYRNRGNLNQLGHAIPAPGTVRIEFKSFGEELREKVMSGEVNTDPIRDINKDLKATSAIA